MTISVERAQASLKDLIERTSQGETVIITQDENPVAELRAVGTVKPAPIFGSCKGMITIVADDEEHLRDFAEYMK